MRTRIKELRENEKMSQAGLAKATGFTQGSISQWELGAKEPTASALIALANFFRVSIDYLLYQEDDFGIINIVYSEVEKNTNFNLIAELWEKLSPIDRERILERGKTLLELQLTDI